MADLPRWPRGTASLALDYQQARVLPCELVAWAVARLEEGDDGEVAVLAGLDLRGPVSIFETGPLFEAALRERGEPLPAIEVTARAFVAEVARDVVEGRVPPIEAARSVLRRAVDVLGWPPDLTPWVLAATGDSPFSGDALDDEELEPQVRELAKEYLQDGRARG
jgi:hypothetical protein